MSGYYNEFTIRMPGRVIRFIRGGKNARRLREPGLCVAVSTKPNGRCDARERELSNLMKAVLSGSYDGPTLVFLNCDDFDRCFEVVFEDRRTSATAA